MRARVTGSTDALGGQSSAARTVLEARPPKAGPPRARCLTSKLSWNWAEHWWACCMGGLRRGVSSVCVWPSVCVCLSVSVEISVCSSPHSHSSPHTEALHNSEPVSGASLSVAHSAVTQGVLPPTGEQLRAQTVS